MTPKVGERQVPKLQYVVWAPKVEGNPSQAIAFVYENDLYYKPKVQSDLGECAMADTTVNFRMEFDLRQYFHFVYAIQCVELQVPENWV